MIQPAADAAVGVVLALVAGVAAAGVAWGLFCLLSWLGNCLAMPGRLRDIHRRLR